jgi:hypothetical protein
LSEAAAMTAMLAGLSSFQPPNSAPPFFLAMKPVAPSSACAASCSSVKLDTGTGGLESSGLHDSSTSSSSGISSPFLFSDAVPLARSPTRPLCM